jgi:hypothetical protein
MKERIDNFVYDLHTGRLDDLEFAIKALTKEPLDTPKTLIVITSVLSWAGNEHKIVEDKPEPKEDEQVPEEVNYDIPEEERLAPDERWEEIEVPDEDYEKELSFDDEDIPKKMKKIRVKRKMTPPPIKYKRVGYTEEEYTKRIPLSSYEKIKNFEDYLLNLNFENLNIYIVCAGVPYGNAETIFNYFFKVNYIKLVCLASKPRRITLFRRWAEYYTNYTCKRFGENS